MPAFASERSGSAPGAKGRAQTKHLLSLGAILIVAAILRLWDIGRESLWADEGLTLVLAHWPVAEMV